MAILATLPIDRGGLDGTVIYFDTETTFSVKRLIAKLFSIDSNRLLEIAVLKDPEYFDEANLNLLASRITVFNITNFGEILETYHISNFILT